MNWDTLDDDTLGQAVDAWLGALRAQGLSDRRIRELAGLLGQAMSNKGSTTSSQERTLRRFEAWRQPAFNQQPKPNIPESGPRR